MQINPEFHSHRIIVFHSNQDVYNRDLVVFKVKKSKRPNVTAAKNMLLNYRIAPIERAIFINLETDQEDGRFENGQFTGRLFS